MVWLIFSLIAVFLWAIINVTDKIVMDKWTSEPLVPVTVGVILGLLSSFAILFTKGFGQLTPGLIFMAVISGGFYLLMGYFYYKAVCVEEISRIIPLFYISNILIVVFAAMFLGEILSLVKYLAMFCIFVGAVLISVRKLRAPRLDKGTFYMVFAAVSAAISVLLNKYILGHTDYWTVFSLNRFGGFLFLLPIFYINRETILHNLTKTKKVAFGIFSITGAINLVAVVLFTIAMSVGLATVVTGLTAIQPMIVLILTVIVGLFVPGFISEDMSRKVLIRKSIAIALVVIGAVLLV